MLLKDEIKHVISKQDQKYTEAAGDVKVQLDSKDGFGTIHYELRSIHNATLFRRILNYTPKRFVHKKLFAFLLKPFMRNQSKKAVMGLKTKLES